MSLMEVATRTRRELGDVEGGGGGRGPEEYINPLAGTELHPHPLTV
jgi:hypothetical protein